MPTRLHRRDVPGHVHFLTISCHSRLTFFWHDAMKRVVCDGIRTLQVRHGVCIIGYVVMPEHVHLLVYPHKPECDTPIPISLVLQSFKQHVGYYGKGVLRILWRRRGSLWSPGLNDWAHGRTGKRVIWAPRGYDFNIVRHETLLTKLDYIHKNPITRGLVDRADDWQWSSFRYYEMGDRSILAMDWDKAWPIIW